MFVVNLINLELGSAEPEKNILIYSLYSDSVHNAGENVVEWD